MSDTRQPHAKCNEIKHKLPFLWPLGVVFTNGTSSSFFAFSAAGGAFSFFFSEVTASTTAALLVLAAFFAASSSRLASFFTVDNRDQHPIGCIYDALTRKNITLDSSPALLEVGSGPAGTVGSDGGGVAEDIVGLSAEGNQVFR